MSSMVVRMTLRSTDHDSDGFRNSKKRFQFYSNKLLQNISLLYFLYDLPRKEFKMVGFVRCLRIIFNITTDPSTFFFRFW